MPPSTAPLNLAFVQSGVRRVVASQLCSPREARNYSIHLVQRICVCVLWRFRLWQFQSLNWICSIIMSVLSCPRINARNEVLDMCNRVDAPNPASQCLREFCMRQQVEAERGADD